MGTEAPSRETVAVPPIRSGAGTAITGDALRAGLRIAEALGGITEGPKVLRPMIGRQTGLAFQIPDEIQRIGNSAPDAGQENGAAVAVADDQRVDIAAQRARQLRLALAGDMPRCRQNGYMEMDRLKLRRRQRRKARIVERRFVCIVHDVIEKR